MADERRLTVELDAETPAGPTGADEVGGKAAALAAMVRAGLPVPPTRVITTAWLVDELVLSAASHRFVIVVSPTPWIDTASPTSDTWGGFAEERGRISEVVASHDITNLMLVAGDAHMVAIDDGTNSDYSSDGSAPVPVLQAAALDRPGSTKGGPYSHGTFPGVGPFGLVRIGEEVDGSTEVTLEGRTYEGETLVSYTFEVEAG